MTRSPAHCVWCGVPIYPYATTCRAHVVLERLLRAYHQGVGVR